MENELRKKQLLWKHQEESNYLWFEFWLILKTKAPSQWTKGTLKYICWIPLIVDYWIWTNELLTLSETPKITLVKLTLPIFVTALYVSWIKTANSTTWVECTHTINCLISKLLEERRTSLSSYSCFLLLECISLARTLPLFLNFFFTIRDRCKSSSIRKATCLAQRSSPFGKQPGDV